MRNFGVNMLFRFEIRAAHVEIRGRIPTDPYPGAKLGEGWTKLLSGRFEFTLYT